MNFNKCHKGSLLAIQRFTFLLNYLVKAGIKNIPKENIKENRR